MVDWPHELVATIFFQGCPWRCPYCHNPHLLPAEEGLVEWTHVMETLSHRTKLLDGVVLSGGEPLLQHDIKSAISELRELGFRIGMHTAGAVPDRFIECLPMLDWVGFDVKAPFAKYDELTKISGSAANARASFRALVASGTPFEVRTTVHADLLLQSDLIVMATELAEEGVQTWALQQFRELGAELDVPTRVVDLHEVARSARADIPYVEVR